MTRRLVVALGGNALDVPGAPDGGAGVVVQTAASLATLILEGYELVITHGNGPQVGELLLDQGYRPDRGARPLSLDVLVAMTQAQLGYQLQREIEDELVANDDHTDVMTVITEVVVDRDDPAFGAPSKPVGPRLDHRPDDGYPYVEEADGRWRRLVASPEPVHLVEAPALRAIVSDGIVPICAGGGGVPVVRDGSRLVGVEAVIDKDLVSALVARELDADALVILTDVAALERDHGTDDATPIDRLSIAEATEMLPTLPAGSMRPKVQAAIRAAEDGREAVIGGLADGLAVVRGEAGTRIVVEAD